LLTDFGKLAPRDDFVPLGLFLALPLRLCRVIGGDGKIGDSLAPWNSFWIAA
jgi:hypothetical protein